MPLIMMYALCLFLIYILAYIFYIPLQYVMRLITGTLLGGALLWIINLLGGSFGFSVAINPITALVSGLLGIPGVVLIIALKGILPKGI
jgi:inhibitor of the pro-sigma K processing machinery